MSDQIPASVPLTEVQVALVGAGRWGQRLGAAIARQPALSLRWVCDRDPAALARLAAAEPGVGSPTHQRPALSARVEEVLADPRVEAIVVAVDPSGNGDLALRALECGKHVLIEKPFATSIEVGQRIVREAEARGLVAGVGHVLRYQPVFCAVERMLASGELGAPWGLVAQRLGSHRQRELGPWWVLAPHDLSLAADWFGGAAHEVHLTEGHLVDARLGFADGAFGRLLLGSHPERRRETLLLTSAGAIRVDEGRPEDGVELYRFSPELAETTREHFASLLREPFVALRTEVERLLGPLQSTPVPVRPGDALDAELLAFSNAVRRGQPLPTSARASLPVLEMLVAGDRSGTSSTSNFRGDAARTSASNPACDGFA